MNKSVIYCVINYYRYIYRHSYTLTGVQEEHTFIINASKGLLETKSNILLFKTEYFLLFFPTLQNVSKFKQFIRHLYLSADC